ncbi:MAG: DUF4870 domain-containing protein [Phycisphaerae bacterium]|jgi:hypothetical protein
MTEEQTPQQTQPVQPEQPVVAQPVETNKDAKTMAMLCHLLAIFTGFLGPLIIWLIKKDEQPFTNEQGKESLNFQITVLMAMIASGILGVLTCGFGFIIYPAVVIVDIVFCVIATIKVNNGEHYRYPISWRLIK